MRFSLISASNNDSLLRGCLLQSPDLAAPTEVIIQRGFTSAADAYNSAIRQASSDMLVFAHQDVYFPGGWLVDLQKAIEAIAATDPNWGVLGSWGFTRDRTPVGLVYWSGVDGVAGRPFTGGIEVESLDEMVLILRRSSGLRFDERLPGFHMYGPDICLEAERAGMKSYAISAFCVHNNQEYRMLPADFWKSYFYMRRKWFVRLPITTTCTRITRWCWPMIRWNAVRAVNLALRRDKPAARVSDPRLLYEDLVRRGLVTTS